MKMPKKTVVLTSRENFSWWSMQEIIPGICECWMESANEFDHTVLVLDIDAMSLGDILKNVINADTLVVSCFTVKLARLIGLLRTRFQIPARLVIYLHNQATIACWPLHVWGMGEVLREDDLFISSCQRDAETLKTGFNNPRVEVIPFGLKDISPQTSYKPPLEHERANLLVYVGRISPQKNLHTLLLSLSLLHRAGSDFRLEIYGSEDELGSPNMGYEGKGYLKFLTELREELGLADAVSFKGFLPRETIQAELSAKSHLVVSASIHSDENFGMAVFRSLCSGSKAVLTDWGGHTDFDRHFPGQIRFVGVHSSSRGPFVDPVELADGIRSSLRDQSQTFDPNIPKFYSYAFISNQLRQIGLEPFKPGPKLRPSALAMRILKKRNELLPESARGCKIFSSYEDRDAHVFLAGYGMKSTNRTPSPDSVHLVPWAKKKNNLISVSDPHRGDYEFSTGHASRLELFECGWLHGNLK